MKSFVFTFLVGILLAACNMEPREEVLGLDIPIEAQANAWQLLGTALDFSKSAKASDSSSAVDRNGNLMVAWQEFNTLQHLIYVKHWTGNQWSLLGSPLNVDADEFAYQPSLAVDASGFPSVAWEEDALTTRNVYVKRWNGSSWTQLGSALNTTANDGAQNPSLAVDSSGNPVVAWEGDTLKGGDYQSDVYVKRWNGAAWVQLGGALDVSPGRNAIFPSLATASNGNFIVAWTEYEGFTSTLYVKHWTGSAWQSLGSALNLSSGGVLFSSVALDASGKPVVAWAENSNIYVKRWSGTSWVQVGRAPLNINAAQRAGEPSLALDGAGNPIVAWHEFNSNTFYNLYVRRWNGTAWVNVGTNPLESKTSNYAFNASLALEPSGKPVVSWEECDATQLHSSGTSCLTGADVYVKRFTSQGWQPLGRAVDIRLANDAFSSSLARKSNDLPVVAWQEMSNIYVKEWNGSTWTRLGNKLNANSGSTPMIIMRSDDKPVVAWTENGNQIHVKFWNGSSWQSLGSVADTSILSFALAVGSNNNPIVAYSAFGNDGEATNLYLKRWNGTVWVGMNGSSTVTPLDIDLSRDAQVPALAVDSTGKPAVAWLEFAVGIQSIYVKQWTGTAWVQRGENLETFPAHNPSIDIDSTGKPVVAWEERVFDNGNINTNIYAKRWSGSSWLNYEATGNLQTLSSGQPVDKFVGNNAYDAVLQLRSDNQPVIAITQLVQRDGVSSFDIYVRRWNPSQAAWVDVGVPVDNNVAFSAKGPSLVLRSNNPIVSWEEDDGSSFNVYVKQY
jgi:hypothetical protein